MNKNTLKSITAIAENLAITMYTVKDRVEISGKDLLLGDTKEVEGEPVDPDKTYIMEMPMQIASNHKRRMKRAYKRGGVEGVINYLKPFTPSEKHEELCRSVKQFIL